MEAYVLFARGEGAAEVIRCREEQEEDIGCASESSATASSSSDEVELADDASSSGSTGLFDMASLVTQLPIKRGLSKFFDGKSQSFASLAAVGGLEDLPKPPAKRLKVSRSCGVGLNKDAHHGRRLSAACKKQASRPRLSPARRLVRARPMATPRPEALAAGPGHSLFFA